jgi:8-oxo-dGTP pyrophosphatase MutT (NUDIX family)
VLVGEREGCRGVWLIRGDALLGVHLNRAQILDKDEEARRAMVRIPPPEVMQARVDHQRTRTWQVSRMTWLPWNGDQDKLRDNVTLQAQQLVAQAAGSAENIQQAKMAAEAIIREFYEEVGWQFTVIWEPEAGGRPRGSVFKRGEAAPKRDSAQRRTIGTYFQPHSSSDEAGGRLVSSSIRVGMASCCSCVCALKLGRCPLSLRGVEMSESHFHRDLGRGSCFRRISNERAETERRNFIVAVVQGHPEVVKRAGTFACCGHDQQLSHLWAANRPALTKKRPIARRP